MPNASVVIVLLFRYASYDKGERPLPYDHKATSHLGSAVIPDRSFIRNTMS